MEIKLILVSIGLISLIAFVYYVISWHFRKPIMDHSYVCRGEEKNPFNNNFVRVLDVRDGYVKYTFSYSKAESSLSVFYFNSVYIKTKKNIIW